jgi:biotin carboxyl carrier protein
MIVRLEFGGRAREVSLHRLGTGNRFRFAFEGRTLEVSAVRVGRDGWSLLLPDGSQHCVAVTGTPTGGLTVHLPSGDVPVALGRRRGRQLAGSGGVSGPARVEAPMPGRIVRVLRLVGDRVRAGEGLVVVEAMKMENELRAPRDGVVKEVLVVEGALVEAGTALVVVE